MRKWKLKPSKKKKTNHHQYDICGRCCVQWRRYYLKFRVKPAGIRKYGLSKYQMCLVLVNLKTYASSGKFFRKYIYINREGSGVAIFSATQTKLFKSVQSKVEFLITFILFYIYISLSHNFLLIFAFTTNFYSSPIIEPFKCKMPQKITIFLTVKYYWCQSWGRAGSKHTRIWYLLLWKRIKTVYICRYDGIIHAKSHDSIRKFTATQPQHLT